MDRCKVLLLDSYFDFMYALTILSNKRDVVRRICCGCRVEHPSQLQHSCLRETNEQHVDMYFDEMLKAVDEDVVLHRWCTTVDTLDGISPELLAIYKLKIYCADWRATMKTDKWRNKMKKMTMKLVQLERLF